MSWYSFALILFLAAVFFSLQHNLLQITRQCSGVIRHTQISIRVRFYGYRALVLMLGSFHVPSGTSWGLGKAALCGTVPASLFLTPLLRDQVFSMDTVLPLHTKGFCIQCHTTGGRRETANSKNLDHFAKYLDLLYWDLPFLFSVSTENLLLLPWWQSAAGCWKRFWIIKFGGSGGWRTGWPRSVCHLRCLAELFNRRDFFTAALVLVGHKPKSKKWEVNINEICR